MGEIHALGWNPERAMVAREAMLASNRYCTVLKGIETPPAVSLSRYLLRAMDQGQAGTCWLHAAVCLAETSAVALGYHAFPICRRLVGWVGKQLEGGGNPTEGGSVTDALLAMTSIRGIGMAHESLLPYTDDTRSLGMKPSENVFADARNSHLVLPVDISSDDDCQTMISKKHPCAIGAWWPFNFDDGETFMTSIGGGTYGHALTIIGYVKSGVWPGEKGKNGWWQWRNWHGPLYPPLPAELAALVPGYKSDSTSRTTDFWVRDDLMTDLKRRGNFEYVSATDFDGMGGVVTLPRFLDSSWGLL